MARQDYEIITADITRLDVDAIVNAANYNGTLVKTSFSKSS